MLTLLFLLALQTPQPAPGHTSSQTVLSTHSPAFLSKRLVGTWEQPKSADSQFGQILTLLPDGTATLSTAIIEDLNYNFDGTKLIVVDADEPDEVKESATIVLTGDHMKETNDETHESAEFVRVSPSPATKNSIADIHGTWKRDTRGLLLDPALSDADKQRRLSIAEHGRYYYHPDGRLQVRLPVLIQAGKWAVTSDGSLHLEFNGKARDAKVSFDDEDLMLTNTDGSKESYTRFEP